MANKKTKLNEKITRKNKSKTVLTPNNKKKKTIAKNKKMDKKKPLATIKENNVLPIVEEIKPIENNRSLAILKKGLEDDKKKNRSKKKELLFKKQKLESSKDKSTTKKQRLINLFKEIIRPKVLIPILLLIIIIIIGIYLSKENPIIGTKKSQEFFIGDKVKLTDESVWYVIDNSDSSKQSVTLLAESPIDINGDKVLDFKDYLQFDKNNRYELKAENEDNIGYYLSNTYKEKLTDAENVINVRLLKSKEYIKIRESLNLDYEWTDENWLASSSLGYWWLDSNQNEKIYVVNNLGSYVLQEPTKSNFIRPVLEINKKSVELIESATHTNQDN